MQSHDFLKIRLKCNELVVIYFNLESHVVFHFGTKLIPFGTVLLLLSQVWSRFIRTSMAKEKKSLAPQKLELPFKSRNITT